MKVLRSVAGLVLAALSIPAFAADELRVVDLTGQFDQFAMSTTEMPDADRVIAFEKQIGPIANGFYERDRRPQGYDFRILTQLKTYPERRAETLAVSRQFSKMFNPARHRFEAAFGPVKSRQPVFLIDSMGELDGGTRELNGKYTMLFGADVIAEFHAGKSLDAFFYHELFHLYHEPTLAGCMTLWCSLWAEGLATYASSRLDPGASDEELVLTLPKPIRPAVEADREKAVCAVVSRLNSNNYDDFSALFQGDDQLPGLPSRMGYYIGYLVARDIGRTHNLQRMAKMSLIDAKPLIDASLARMATCTHSTVEARERSRTSRTGS